MADLTELVDLELIDLVRVIAGREDTWRAYLELPASGENRWWRRLHGGDQVDVWLLSWLPGQATDLHDHGASAAAFTVVQGQLDEARLTATGRQVILPRTLGSTSWVAPGVPHDVRGTGVGPAVSIHAYSPPLARMTYWEADEAGVLRPSRTVLSDEPEGQVA